MYLHYEQHDDAKNSTTEKAVTRFAQAQKIKSKFDMNRIWCSHAKAEFWINRKLPNGCKGQDLLPLLMASFQSKVYVQVGKGCLQSSYLHDEVKIEMTLMIWSINVQLKIWSFKSYLRSTRKSQVRWKVHTITIPVGFGRESPISLQIQGPVSCR